MRSAFARRGPPGRVSPVPCQAVASCPPPYPGSVLHPSGSIRHDPVTARGYWDPRGTSGCSLLPSPRHDRLGHSSLSVIYVTGLQGSRFRIGPEALLPSTGPYGPVRAFDAPLRRRDLSPHPEPATRRTGAYRGGAHTRKSDTAGIWPQASSFRTRHGGVFYAMPVSRARTRARARARSTLRPPGKEPC